MSNTFDKCTISETGAGWLPGDPKQIRIQSMNTVRAKFICHAKEETIWNNKKLFTVKFRPVGPKYKQNPVTKVHEMDASENSTFWHASPTGTLELGCINQAAADFYKVGEEYYLDFIQAPHTTESAA